MYLRWSVEGDHPIQTKYQQNDSGELANWAKPSSHMMG